MRSIHILPLCLLIACGDDGGKKQADGGVQIDAAVDASPDAPMVIPCAYTEANDATNDDFFGGGTAESTSINFTGTATAVCGAFNSGHHDVADQAVDVDSYMFHVPTGTRGIVHLTGAGSENFDFVKIEIYGMSNGIDETGLFTGTHAVTAADLPAGDYEITVGAYDTTAAAASVNYKLTLELDSATRCAKSTATAIPEAGETVAGGGNDVYEVRYGAGTPKRKLTDLATDGPESTGITVAPGASHHLTGALSTFTVTPVSQMDSFLDRDAYAITAGSTTNQLAVRANWPGSTADLDILVFPEGSFTERATGWYMGNTEDEFTTLAVTPGAKYWIFVGLLDGSTGQPINYDLTVCGDTYTP